MLFERWERIMTRKIGKPARWPWTVEVGPAPISRWGRNGGAFTGSGKALASRHSERSEESRSECFQGNARFLVACGSSE